MTEPLSGRSCEGCTMCCKIFEIDELAKPQGVWCEHCAIGSGCKIYESRPPVCQVFMCGYRVDAALSEDWKPSVSKFVLFTELPTKRITIHMDSNRSDTWKKEPYYSQLKKWSRAIAPMNRQVVIFIGKRAIVILPDEDADLGIVSTDERIVTKWSGAGPSRRYIAYKCHKDDPRISRQAAQSGSS
jgi:hypothetical protein